MFIARVAYYLSSIPTLLLGFENWWVIGVRLLGLGDAKGSILRLRRSGLRFRVRTAMDVWVVKEVCLDRDYERGGMRPQDGWTIIDVGAGIGDFSISLGARFPQGRVIALEPFPPSFRVLKENIALNRLENVTPLPYALGAASGPRRLHAGAAEPGQSSTARRGRGVVQEPEEVPGRSLAALFEELGIERCDVLKMDCEGAEYEILMSSDDATLGKIENLVLEYHDTYTEHEHEELAAFLQGKGYTVRTRPSPAHREIGFLFADRPGRS
jgi:FkbM family methyltransferase